MNSEDRRLFEYLSQKITVLSFELERLEARVKKSKDKMPNDNDRALLKPIRVSIGQSRQVATAECISEGHLQFMREYVAREEQRSALVVERCLRERCSLKEVTGVSYLRQWLLE